MTGFESLFSFYSLLLGLAVANVATGLASSWRLRAKTSIGTTTLLLGLLILLSAAQQWLSFWGARDGLTMGPWEVLTCMAMSLPYIFISQAMLPHEKEDCTDLGVYYLENSRALMLALAVPPIVSLLFNLSLQEFSIHQVASYVSSLRSFSYYWIRLAIPMALVFSKSQRLHVLGLGLLVINILIRIFASS